MEIKNYNSMAYKKSCFYRKLKIASFIGMILSIVVAVLFSIFQMIALGVVFLILAFVMFFVFRINKDLYRVWTLAVQPCPKCDNWESVTCTTDESQKGAKRFSKFNCEKCQHEWDNENMLNNILNKK